MKRILLLMIILPVLAGCALNTRYISYTDQQFTPKTRYYFVSVYPESQTPSLAQSYRPIGKVEVSGRASDGVNSDTLVDEAKNIARTKGADAIINARTEAISYEGVGVIPGHCGYRRCHPPEYIPYSDTTFTFRGELVVFIPPEIRENK